MSGSMSWGRIDAAQIVNAISAENARIGVSAMIATIWSKPTLLCIRRAIALEGIPMLIIMGTTSRKIMMTMCGTGSLEEINTIKEIIYDFLKAKKI